ncbi:MAG: DUF2723 domain-containing protein [Candidatus Zixiibacteriota bacterium]|nr:MAG: DUF2723 domain-containing protein [candidate division Zixibacteria bacterium]
MKKPVIPFLIFGFSFIYYFYQACPTFYFWDSAELTAAVPGGGVPHPPGFPSLLIIAKLWIKIIPLDKAYSLNLLSAFFASLGLMFWYLVVRDVMQRLFPERSKTEPVILSLVSAAAVGLSFSYSIQAVRFEVYSLNFACFALLLLLTLRLSFHNKKNNALYMIIMVFVTAISLGAHHFTAALTFPGILLILYFHKKLKPKYLFYFAVSTFVLLIPLYLSIYLLSLKNPVLNWGDPSTLRNFLDYFFLREFSTPLSRLAPGHLAYNLTFAVSLISKQIGILGSLFALWGIIKLIRLTPKLAVPFVVILIPNMFSILYFEEYFYENYDLHGYVLFSIAFLSLFMVAIIGFLSERLNGLFRDKISGKNQIYSLLFMIAMAAIIIYMPLKRNIFSANLSRTATAGQFADLLLNDAPKNSVIVTSYYNTYFCLLAHQALNPSADPKTITNVYNWEHQWGRNQTAALLDFDPDEASTRPDFYRTLLNRIKDYRSIYVEYDNASAPLINFLKPSGLGYRFSISDTTLNDTFSPAEEIEYYYEIASKSRDIESIRTWILWFTNRGQFYLKRGESDLANRYFEAAEKIASRRK